MPRQARLDMPGALHHIMVRGINKSKIFQDDQDRERFLQRLGKTIIEAECTVHAWVLMGNHVHLLFKSGRGGISTVMRKLLTWYAQYFNRRHHRTGHLFENRYKSILCEEENYFLTLVRYIHLNPIRAKIVTTMSELNRYQWGGHSAMMGKRDFACAWMDTAYVLAQFGTSKKLAQKAYQDFVQEGMQQGQKPELTGGGLVRSLGGWSQVLSVRRRGEKAEYDERILGNGEFVNRVLRESEEKQIRQLKIKHEGVTIMRIVEQECTKGQISPEELKSGSRRKKVSDLRSLIAWRGVRELGASSAEIARNLGVATSSITRAMTKRELKGFDP